jgi:hypothetical protein
LESREDSQIVDSKELTAAAFSLIAAAIRRVEQEKKGGVLMRREADDRHHSVGEEHRLLIRNAIDTLLREIQVSNNNPDATRKMKVDAKGVAVSCRVLLRTGNGRSHCSYSNAL